MENFARRNVQYGFQRSPNGKNMYAALRVYAAATKDRTEFRFHINQLNAFKEHLTFNYLKDDMVDYIYIPVPTPVDASLPIFAKWVPLEHQLPVIEYLMADNPVSKFVDLQTGKGKSFISMYVLSKFAWRTLIIVKPMYLEKWIEDLTRTYDIDPKDLLVIRGANQLLALLMLAENGELTSKIILIANRTLQNWIKLYENFGEGILEMGYPCGPDKLCAILGVGFRIIDEVHQDFHLNYKIDLYTNVARSISLSATLLSEESFMNRMYEIAYPIDSRYKGQAYHKYIAARAVIYKLKNPDSVRTKEFGSNTYSHHQFEKSILKSNSLTSGYLKLIKEIIESSYLTDYKKGQRCLIFCASIDMCSIVTDYLRKQYPDKDVRRYVEEDTFDNLMEADICVSTLISSGTAVDIPNLSTVILTTAVASIQSNVQSFGRLRELKDGTTPEFWYFACENVPKHLEYHEKKRLLFTDRALTYKAIFMRDYI